METKSAVVVPNRAGLHARPCHAIVSTALRFESEIRVCCAGRSVNGKSILDLMTLSAAQGARLELVAQGADSGELVRALEDLIRSGFGEPS